MILDKIGSKEHGEKFRRNQYFAALSSNFGAISFGTVIAWSSTALPSLRKDMKIGPLLMTQESWIASFMLIGAFFSGPIIGLMIKRLGRRMSILTLSVPALAGWALIAFAVDVQMIYIGRFLTGLVSGCYSIVVPIYVAETSDPDIRGKLSAGFDLGIATGILYSLVLGSFCEWRIQAVICSLFTMLTFFLMLFVPETPRYLVRLGKFDKAIRSLCWIHNTKDEASVDKELSLLKISAQEHIAQSSKRGLKNFKKSHVLKPFSIAVLIHFVSSMTGVAAICAYSADIFSSTGTNVDEHLAIFIFALTDFFAAILSALVVDKFGRKPLLIISQLLMAVTLGATSFFFFLKHKNNDVSLPGLDWLPVTALGLFVAAFAFGTGPVSFILMAEILPVEGKGVLGTSLICGVKQLSAFIVTKYFLEIMKAFGEPFGYLIFSVFCLAGGLYIVIFVPETKGKSLEEIQSYYSR